MLRYKIRSTIFDGFIISWIYTLNLFHKIHIKYLLVKRVKNVLLFSLLFSFFLPSIVKIAHHHEHFFCTAHNENHIHKYHENCVICNFQYSTFLNEKFWYKEFKTALNGFYNPVFISCNYRDISKFSFLLRAPPWSIQAVWEWNYSLPFGFSQRFISKIITLDFSP